MIAPDGKPAVQMVAVKTQSRPSVCQAFGKGRSTSAPISMIFPNPSRQHFAASNNDLRRYVVRHGKRARRRLVRWLDRRRLGRFATLIDDQF